MQERCRCQVSGVLGRDKGMLFLGKFLENVSIFLSEKHSDGNGKKYAWIVKSATLVNQFYFYCVKDNAVGRPEMRAPRHNSLQRR